MKRHPGFLLPCPHCGERHATFTLDLSSMGDAPLTCASCDKEFTVAYMRELLSDMVRCWTPVLDWLEAAPVPSADDVAHVISG